VQGPGLPGQGRPVASPDRAGTIEDVMADRAALEREMEEIRAQLGWVRDYL
jgi:hypothetical protein